VSKMALRRDGYWTVLEVDGDVIRSRSMQPNRTAILKQNEELRKSPGAIRTMDWGKLELDIPITDWIALGKMYPGLTDPAHPDHKAQMALFLKSPASDIYRVQERKRGVNAQL
jgi:hypothetical protein